MQVIPINPERGTFRINGARMVYHNFTGQDPTYVRVTPNFTLLIDDPEGEKMLLDAGYSIYGIGRIRDDGSESWHTLKVKFKCTEKYQPEFKMCANGKVTPIHPDHIADLERLRIETVDAYIHAFDYTNPKTKETTRSAYLDACKVYLRPGFFEEDSEDSGAVYDECPF